MAAEAEFPRWRPQPLRFLKARCPRRIRFGPSAARGSVPRCRVCFSSHLQPLSCLCARNFDEVVSCFAEQESPLFSEVRSTFYDEDDNKVSVSGRAASPCCITAGPNLCLGLWLPERPGGTHPHLERCRPVGRSPGGRGAGADLQGLRSVQGLFSQDFLPWAAWPLAVVIYLSAGFKS